MTDLNPNILVITLNIKVSETIIKRIIRQDKKKTQPYDVHKEHTFNKGKQ